MSQPTSNLASIYYNLATAVTQDSINSTMNFYLEGLDGVLEEVMTKKSGVETEMTLDHFIQLSGVDPFTIPDGTTVTYEQYFGPSSYPDLTKDQLNLITSLKNGLEYGLKAKTGIASTWTSIPPVVQIESQGTQVVYNMFFASNTCIDIDQDMDNDIITFHSWSQPADYPWIFSWSVNLALTNATGDTGAPTPQNDLFSVQQLYLDLNTLVDGKAPTITGPSASCLQFVAATVDTYVQNIPAGQSTISYVQQQTTGGADATLTVTDVSFLALPNTDNPGLSTLNYLCMTADKKPPKAVEAPTWDWIDSENQVSGVMAIESTVFLGTLLSAFSQGFDQFSMETSGTISYQNDSSNFFDPKCSGSFHYDYQAAPSDAGQWQVSNDFASGVLATASYSCDDQGQRKEYTNECSYCGSISAYWKYFMNATLTFENLGDGTVAFTLDMTITTPLHAYLCGVERTKNVLDLEAKMVYVLSIEPSGKIIVTPTYSYPKDTFDSVSSLSTTCGDKDFKDQNDVCYSMYNYLLQQFPIYESAVLKVLENSLTWYFPATNTFQFSDIAISDHGDFVVNITYAEATTDGAGNPGVA